MKRLSLIGKIVLLFAFTLAFHAGAQNVNLKTRSTQIGIDNTGHFSSIRVEGKDILHAGKYPLVTVCADNKLITPTKMTASGNQLKLTMSDGGTITLKQKESDVCITLEATNVPDKYEVLLFGPLAVNIHEVVGDVVGVAQGDGLAFGIQALNIKTNAGIPDEYGKLVTETYGYSGKSAELSVASIPAYKLAAADISDGTVFHFSARRRNKQEYRQVQQIEKSLVLPVEGEDGPIKGAKIAFFGSKNTDALARIGEIEVEQGLPHPLFNGEWGKTSRAAMKSYLISDFSEDNFDMILDKAKIAGFEYVYHSGPFLDWGHFNWDPKFTKDGDEGVKKMVDKAKAQGIAVGVHTLSNFTTTNDAYVTPVPSEHLLKQGVLTLTSDLDKEQTAIKIKKSDLFSMPMSLNAMQIDKELITYGSMEDQGDTYLLKDCKRGAYGTTASAHAQKTPLYKLWDYPYKTLFPDLVLQDKFADRLAEIMNKTGLRQISFDGLEGCSYTGQDEYANSRFVTRFYNQLNHNVLNDASRLSHNLWHIHTRMNWGEPWGEAMRTGQVENRIKNQHFFQRNLFPRMLGWFLIRLADRNFECSTLEDLEWALSESAGFDSGYAMTINSNTLRRHGQIDKLLEAIKNWDKLREAQAFSDEQKARLKDPQTEWHLEKTDEQTYNLYPLSISKHFRCNMAEMQPGQPGGADWSWSSPYESVYAIRLKVDGDGTIKDPSFTTPKGVIKFPCEISDRQYLLYTFDGKAVVTDKNYNVINEVTPQGNALLPAGSSAVAFSCEQISEDAPEVIIRYITKGTPEVIKLNK
ncbi:hypothetical protein HMPREF1212_00851 [Parabacteroides sp. HGS0025]|uniref:hypothetical protein n=1 Tax=Parabacteroides sp. HGS0025 TaxID=1078087 RepID=UPI0006175902|nr:hypothetical protein [Parabacteroides sp. HGS0025]KKB52695.1 hypothetical protein HMPREF1212_00851 [Parabacteroides sp. HGS0025]